MQDERLCIAWLSGEPAKRGTYVGHELLDDRPDLRRQRGREHHDLLVVRRLLENVLDVPAHVCSAHNLPSLNTSPSFVINSSHHLCIPVVKGLQDIRPDWEIRSCETHLRSPAPCHTRR